jgi:WD40-like Beta Propeller Repeat
MSTFLFRLLLVLLGCVSPALAQIPLNGNFETGTLANWTLGSDNRAGAVRASYVTGTLVIPEGTWAAAVSSGPGARSTGPLNFDGFGGNNDYDLSWLESTSPVTFSPAFVAFDWAFASSEQNEPDQYDDVMDVKVDGTRIFSRSSCKLNGSSYSPFPNANCQNATQVNNTINDPNALDGVNLRFGPPTFQRTCLEIPAAALADNSVTLRFSVADTNDRNVDSTLFIDDVQIRTSCNEVGSIVQRTNTTGRLVELKGGTFFQRNANARLIANDATGETVAFVTNADLGGNPNLLDQIYTWNGTSFTRASGINVSSGGGISGLAMSHQDSGRYLAIAARLTDTATTQIYRYDRNSNTLTALTSTTGCENGTPSIDGDGGVIAFESTCNALTGSGTAKKIVVWNGTSLSSSLFGTTTTCTMAEPALTKNSNGRYLAFKSTCVHNGTNTDNNFEIYRFDRGSNGNNSGTTTGNFTRITTTSTNGTSGPLTNNSSPVMDGSANGTYIYFLSDGNLTPSAPVFNADFSSEIFRYQVGAGTPTTQRTNSSDSAYIGLDVDTDGTLNYAYERISLLNGQFSVGHRRINGTTDIENNLATGLTTNGVRFGRTSTVIPVVNFISAENFLGTNADRNAEIWQGRVQ